MSRFEPGTNGRQAAANFLADVQTRIMLLMEAKGVSRALLAKRLGVNRSRVTQLFGPHPNMTVDTLARIFEAVGEVPEVVSPGIRGILAEFDAKEGGAGGQPSQPSEQDAAQLFSNVVHLADYLEATKPNAVVMTSEVVSEAGAASIDSLLEYAA